MLHVFGAVFRGGGGGGGKEGGRKGKEGGRKGRKGGGSECSELLCPHRTAANATVQVGSV